MRQNSPKYYLCVQDLSLQLNAYNFFRCFRDCRSVDRRREFKGYELYVCLWADRSTARVHTLRSIWFCKLHFILQQRGHVKFGGNVFTVKLISNAYHCESANKIIHTYIHTQDQLLLIHVARRKHKFVLNWFAASITIWCTRTHQSEVQIDVYKIEVL